MSHAREHLWVVGRFFILFFSLHESHKTTPHRAVWIGKRILLLPIHHDFAARWKDSLRSPIHAARLVPLTERSCSNMNLLLLLLRRCQSLHYLGSNTLLLIFLVLV